MSKSRLPTTLLVVIVHCSLLIAHCTKAQRFGNEWVVNNQQYYKIPIGEDGIYQVDYATLQQAGFPVASVDPRRIQLFFRGVEQAIEVRGQQDARFNPEDYIRFYGQRNDGTIDAELYTSPEAQPHPHYNLYSDTTAYFLTWRIDAGVGKRAAAFSENNVDGLPAEPYHLQIEQQTFANEYEQGRLYPVGSASRATSRLSAFDYGEGWTGRRIRQGESVDYTVTVRNAVTSGPNPRLQLVITGRNNQLHNVTVQVGGNAGSLRTLTTAEFSYYDSYRIDTTLAWSDVGSNQMVVRLTPNGVGGRADNISLALLELNYAQQPDAQNQNQVLNLVGNTNAKSFLEVANPPANAQLWDITDPNNTEAIGYNITESALSAIIPNTNVSRQLILAEVQSVSNMRRVTMPALEASAKFLMVGHPALRQPTGAYSDPIGAYRDYRISTGHQPLLVDINQLYNLFSYGEISPLAIRRFADYMLSVGNPENLLLIGKGLTVNFNYHRRDPATFEVQDYIPPGGMPGSDIIFTTGLRGSDGIGMAIPTGRVNANTAQEVANYLDKVMEEESRTLAEDYQESSTREALWKKNLVHLSGGVSSFELTLYARYVDNFAAIAENHFLGGEVATQQKRTNNATELINIAEEVNQGVSLITFFGHSSTTISDMDIGFVSNDEFGYRNQGKYPAILLNGCNAGNVFSTATTFGEDWIRTANRGALHVMAHSSIGISSILKQYSDRFYEVAFGDSTWIDQPLGAVKKESERRFIEQVGASAWEMHISQVQQLVHQGDPALALFGRSQPDYETNTNSIFVTQLQDAPVTAASDSFAVNCIVRNFGRTQTDSIAISLQRTFSDGTTETYGPVWYPPVFYQDTLQFTVPNQEGNSNAGNNRLEVILDSPDSVAELNEANNRAAIDYFVPISGTVNLAPVNFGIVSTPEATLQVQPGNLQTTLRSGSPRSILVELDTSVTFSSSAKQQTTLETTALAQWSVTLPVTEDSTVYFWRSKYAAPLAGEVDDWNNNSFTYLSESRDGWAQVHPRQWQENTLTNVAYRNNQWEFEESSVALAVTVSGGEGTVNTDVTLNGIPYILTTATDSRLLCKNDAIGAVALTQEGLLPYAVISRGGFDVQDPNTCGRRPQVINDFSNGQITGDGRILEQFIDAVGDNDPVLLFSFGNVDFTAWPEETVSKFQELGVASEALADLQAGEPLIIFGRKNASIGSATVVRADSTRDIPVTEQVISLDEQITEPYRSGSIRGRRIGPARAWQELQTQIIGNDYTITVLGENNTGEVVELLTGLTGQPSVDLSSIDAQQYPYLRLVLETSDPVEQTPAQPESWIVFYSTLPEGTLISVDVSEAIVEKQEGETLTFSGAFYNLSEQDFADSLAVVYTLSNQEQRQARTDTLYMPAPASEDTATFTIAVDTRQRVGTNDITIQVNPQQQPEQTYTNNTLRVDNWLEVIGDATNPIVDVAFDGVYIIDGDIVAPSPLITIQVRDENPYLQKQDTTGIDILLGREEIELNASASTKNARTQNSELRRISLDQPNVSWNPATDDTPFTITYQPEVLEDGIYRLQVQASDASGNASGANPYEITFEVINASTITHFYPYPNPFSTSTRFVFTLTGAEVPDQLKVQIMTVSGKIVREITQDEIGPIRIGNNITQYAWDGRDEYGDELANGVYLYRVIVRNDGQAMEHRETSADRAFTKEFGKLYILR
ncbi:C25 family cysteine peptidase [Tunicatimonas pelagia]|uniref:putative type IX secretion system sortase PorU2 n=1 Tax=Tunicatimonas pelagia TaxID=931531 RepID=UPI00266650B6|nr:C25 family cysteine peptidase [Tunicatimonas pelagia]WKN40421.1 C25 family cysteine peptidase [Tunicatimonas pelagia]